MAMMVCGLMLKDCEEQKLARPIYYRFMKVKQHGFDGCKFALLMLAVFAEILCCYAAEVLI